MEILVNFIDYVTIICFRGTKMYQKNHSKMFEVTTNFRNFISNSFCGTGVGNCKSWLSMCTIQGPGHIHL